jgi:hypothetical protein
MLTFVVTNNSCDVGCNLMNSPIKMSTAERCHLEWSLWEGERERERERERGREREGERERERERERDRLPLVQIT